jgi:hypothetical protein
MTHPRTIQEDDYRSTRKWISRAAKIPLGQPTNRPTSPDPGDFRMEEPDDWPYIMTLFYTPVSADTLGMFETHRIMIPMYRYYLDKLIHKKPPAPTPGEK